MTNEMTIESARNLSDEQLLQALASGLSDMADGILNSCIAVTVLVEREIDLPMLPAVFRHASEIAQGDLSPKAGLILAAYPFLVNAVMGMHIEMQERMAEGEKVKVAVKTDGRIHSVERTIFEMSQMQLRLAFTEGKITPWEQQGEWLLKSGHVEEGPKRKQRPPRFDAKNGLIVAKGSYKVEEFMQALAAAGYQITPIYKGNRLQPAAPARLVAERTP